MRTKEAIIREAAGLAYAAKDPVAIERIIGKCAEELFELQLGGLPKLDIDAWGEVPTTISTKYGYHLSGADEGEL